MHFIISLLALVFILVHHSHAASQTDSLSHPVDSTHTFTPSIESMLEDAGDDRVGASVFLDEIAYYRLSHASRSGVGPGTSSPFAGDAAFPLQSESSGLPLEDVRIDIRSTVERNFTEKKGGAENKWEGSPVHSVQRLQLAAGPLSAGFILEHDPGETFIHGFAAGYAAVSRYGIIEKAIAGTYTVNAGEGLVLSRASLFSKGTMSITQTKKYGAALVPYLSRDEFNFFRGAASTVRSGIWSVTGFFSHRPLPATADASGAVTSFYASGLFRTVNETEKLGAVTEQAGGLSAAATPLPNVSICASAVAAEYDRRLAASSPYAFNGSGMKAFGLSFNSLLSPAAIFGELAGHDIRSLCGVLGSIYRASRDFSFAVHLRSFSGNYNNPFARAFSEHGDVNGERGVYLGIDWNIARGLGLFAYVDHFMMPDPETFDVTGVDYVMRLDGRPVPRFTYTVQMKYKTHSLRTEPDGAQHAVIDEHRRTTLRFQVRYTSAGGYTLTQRCNLSRVSYASSPLREKGILVTADVAKQYTDIGLGFRAGIVLFDTDSFDSGLSVYEPDVRGAATTSILYGKGMRWFIMAHHAVSPRVSLSLKYGTLSKWNESTLGSGDDELLGNTDPQLTFQADLSL